MYKILILVFCVAYVTSECEKAKVETFCEEPLKDIAQKLIEAEKKMQEFCKTNCNKKIREVYGAQEFMTKVDLSEFAASNIVVQVQHRLLSIRAKDCSSQFAVSHILPNKVDGQRGSWKMHHGQLTISFPYQAYDETSEFCSTTINETVTTVPMVPCSDDDHLYSQNMDEAIKHFFDSDSDNIFEQSRRFFRD